MLNENIWDFFSQHVAADTAADAGEHPDKNQQKSAVIAQILCGSDAGDGENAQAYRVGNIHYGFVNRDKSAAEQMRVTAEKQK